MKTFKKGQRVRHVDGRLGTVTMDGTSWLTGVRYDATNAGPEEWVGALTEKLTLLTQHDELILPPANDPRWATAYLRTDLRTRHELTEATARLQAALDELPALDEQVRTLIELVDDNATEEMRKMIFEEQLRELGNEIRDEIIAEEADNG